MGKMDLDVVGVVLLLFKSYFGTFWSSFEVF